MKYFLDFDNCLFDTREGFSPSLRAVFALGGVDDELFTQTIRKNFSNTPHEKKPVYHPHHHLDLLHIAPSERLRIEETIEALYSQVHEFVFTDVLPFLQSLKDDEKIILTYGDNDFQTKKIEGSKLDQFVGETLIVQTDKLPAIAAYMERHGITDERVRYVDDVADYFVEAAQYPNIECVHILRYGEPLCEVSEHRDIRSFHELMM